MSTECINRPADTDSTSSKIEALHLSVTQERANDSSHNVHLLHNSDIGVILRRGQAAGDAAHIPRNGDVDGHLVIALGVDGDHDEVHHQTVVGQFYTLELLTRAIETLEACRNATMRVVQA
jgi:hypothetical protein